MQTAHKHLWNAAALLVIISMLFSAAFIFSASPVSAQDEPPQDPQTGELTLDDPAEAEIGQAEPETAGLLAKAAQDGGAGVIVVLKAPEVDKTGVVASAQDAFAQSMAGYTLQNVYRYQNFPMLAMKVDAAALQALLANPLVESVQEDGVNEASLQDSSIIVGAVEAAQAGYTGAGVTVAIIDTGVDKTHPFLGGRVVEEACFSGANGLDDVWGKATSLCPNNAYVQYGAGAGVQCTGLDGCYHGTHVAGITAGQNATFSGIARDANIIAIQVFSKYHQYSDGGDYLLTWDSDYIKGLDYVYSLRAARNISSVNMSLGGGKYYKYCDKAKSAVKKAIDRLRGANIATVIASGNNGFTNAISSPACISTAISVGSTEKDDSVSDFSNSASFLALLAPGGNIYSSLPGTGYGSLDGTSMATPHVTGAWAVLRQAFPTKNVASILALLKSTGKPVKDYRNKKVKPRINIAAAIAKYQKPTVAPTLISPGNASNLDDSTPYLSWNKLPLVTKYKVTIKKNGTSTVFSKTYNADSYCPYYLTTCQVSVPVILKTGMFTWTVQPYSGAGGGPVSATWSFNTPSVVPAAVALTSPALTGLGYYPSAFTWNIIGTPMADKYLLKIYRENKLYFSKTYLATSYCAPDSCSIPRPVKFLDGNYRWEVWPWNPVGYGTAATATFDYFAANGYNNHFDSSLPGYSLLYPTTADWFMGSSNLYTWYGLNYTWATMTVDANYKDVDVTAVMRRTGQTQYSNALVIHANPTVVRYEKTLKSGYFFEYVNEGYFSVWKVYNGRWYVMQRWAETTAVNPTGANTLRVTAHGKVMNFYINGTLVWSGKDTRYGPDLTSGVVGVSSFVPDWFELKDYLYIDRITSNVFNVTSMAEAESVSIEQQALNDAANASLTGSIYGPRISESEVEALQAMMGQTTTLEQKMKICQDAGGPCPVIEP